MARREFNARIGEGIRKSTSSERKRGPSTRTKHEIPHPAGGCEGGGAGPSMSGRGNQDFRFSSRHGAIVHPSPSCDPPWSVLILREPSSSPRGAVLTGRKIRNPGTSVFSAPATNTSPAQPPFSQDFHLSGPFLTPPAPVALRSAVPCSRTAAASDGSPPASASSTGHA